MSETNRNPDGWHRHWKKVEFLKIGGAYMYCPICRCVPTTFIARAPKEPDEAPVAKGDK